MKKLILAGCVAAWAAPTFAQNQQPQQNQQGQNQQGQNQQPQQNQQQQPSAYDIASEPGRKFAEQWGQDPTGGNLSGWVQGAEAGNQQPSATRPRQAPTSQGDYGYYGGPSGTPNSATRRSGTSSNGLFGPYRLYNVPNDLNTAGMERDHMRGAAVESGKFRRQFPGSTQFWMDQHRTELSKSRSAMDEQQWRTLHPSEYFGDGGYTYHTAVSVGSGVLRVPAQPGVEAVAAPVAAPIVNTAPVKTTPVPARRQRVTPTPRVIAAEKPLSDATESVEPIQR